VAKNYSCPNNLQFFLFKNKCNSCGTSLGDIEIKRNLEKVRNFFSLQRYTSLLFTQTYDFQVN
jgi:hypothetical protein